MTPVIHLKCWITLLVRDQSDSVITQFRGPQCSFWRTWKTGSGCHRWKLSTRNGKTVNKWREAAGLLRRELVGGQQQSKPFWRFLFDSSMCPCWHSLYVWHEWRGYKPMVAVQNTQSRSETCVTKSSTVRFFGWKQDAFSLYPFLSSFMFIASLGTAHQHISYVYVCILLAEI